MIPKLGNVTFEQILFVIMKLLISLVSFTNISYLRFNGKKKTVGNGLERI